MKRHAVFRGRIPRILDPEATKLPISDYPPSIPSQFSHYPVTIWSQLSDSVFLDRVNRAKIPLFYGLVKHFSRTPPNPSCTPNLLAIARADVGRLDYG